MRVTVVVVRVVEPVDDGPRSWQLDKAQQRRAEVLEDLEVSGLLDQWAGHAVITVDRRVEDLEEEEH